MPTLTDTKLRTAIADGKIFAVSIDTVVFDAKQKRLDNAVLRSLDQFTQSDIEVVIADVVAKEIKAHLQEDARKTQRALKRALRTHNIRWQREKSEQEHADLLMSADPVEFAEAEFGYFLEKVNGKVLGVLEQSGSSQRIVDLYFAAKPPFGKTEQRKSEFPDAYALLTLEEYAVTKGKLLLCVSADKGWLEFAAESEYLVCVSQLEHALQQFNTAYQHIADTVVQEWLKLDSVKRIGMVKEAMEYCLTDFGVEISVESEFLYDAELLAAVVESLNVDTIGKPQVIDKQGDTVTFTIGLEAHVCFEASFSFYIRDGVDKYYVDFGSKDAYVDTQVPFELIITADRSLQDELIFHVVDATTGHFELDFGYVNAFSDEDERYDRDD